MYAIMQETYGNGIVIGCILSLAACISSKLVLHKYLNAITSHPPPSGLTPQLLNISLH